MVSRVPGEILHGIFDINVERVQRQPLCSWCLSTRRSLHTGDRVRELARVIFFVMRPLELRIEEGSSETRTRLEAHLESHVDARVRVLAEALLFPARGAQVESNSVTVLCNGARQCRFKPHNTRIFPFSLFYAPVRSGLMFNKPCPRLSFFTCLRLLLHIFAEGCLGFRISERC